MAADLNPGDPLRAYNFHLVIDDIAEVQFQECSGLDSHTATVDYREGFDKSRPVRKIPGLRSVSAIMLKRGMVADQDKLWDWYKRADRRLVQIMLLDHVTFEEKIKWELRNAWPTKWVGPAFNATTTALAIETLELTVEEIERV